MREATINRPNAIVVPNLGFDYDNLSPGNMGSSENILVYPEDATKGPFAAVDRLAEAVGIDLEYEHDMRRAGLARSPSVMRVMHRAVEAVYSEVVTAGDLIDARDEAMKATRSSWYAMSSSLQEHSRKGNLKQCKVLAGRLNASFAEVYDLPEQDIAKQLIATQVSENKSLAAVYEDLIILDDTEVGQLGIEKLYEVELQEIENVITEKYGEAIDKAIPEEERDRLFSMHEAVERLELFVSEVKDTDDSVNWSTVEIRYDENSASFSVKPKEDGQIGAVLIVPGGRSDVTGDTLRGLISHELLWHAARRANSSASTDERVKQSKMQSVSFEEGGAVSSEIAFNKTMDPRFVDRYVDIAIASGQVDGKMRSRVEMLNFALERASIRKGVSIDDLSESERKDVSTHIDRMYRGGIGDGNPETATVFLKDADYYSGTVRFLKWWRDMRETMDPKSVYELARQGRIDFAIPENLEYFMST